MTDPRDARIAELKAAVQGVMYEARDDEMTKFLEGVESVVEATHEEQFRLWERYKAVGWEQRPSGFGPVVGSIANMPIAISLFRVKVQDTQILFWHPTSQVVDHRIIDRWIKAHIPKSAYDGDRINQSDAANFHNALLRRARAAIPAPKQEGI